MSERIRCYRGVRRYKRRAVTAPPAEATGAAEADTIPMVAVGSTAPGLPARRPRKRRRSRVVAQRSSVLSKGVRLLAPSPAPAADPNPSPRVRARVASSSVFWDSSLS